ncbi:MAG: FAD binding domain-containing protein [Deltaproteobacteria bacterium]|nr:FAD binding domain-containing protein [Deltaproteobacteria bacterium]
MTKIDFPPSVDEACRLMADSGGAARIIAGGVAVMVLVRHRLFFPEHLISLKKIPALDQIQFDEEHGLRIGALVTHRQVESSATIKEHYPALAVGLGQVGNLRVRNLGTVVGDLCHADNHSDPAPLLTVLGAKVKARSIRGERLIPIEGFHRDIYTTALQNDEIVTDVLVPPLRPKSRTAYLRLSGDSGIDRPLVGVAGLLSQEEGYCREMRLTVGSLTSVPLTFSTEAETLQGKELTSGATETFVHACLSRIESVADGRGSTWYKKQIAETYIRRTIRALLNRKQNRH